MNEKDGRCAVVLPQGVLFRGRKEGDMRKKLIESDKLECVITLVRGVFYSTGVSACILLLNNNKTPAHKNKIMLIDGAKFYTTKRAQVLMTQEDIDKVFSIYQNYSDIVEVSKVISIDDAKNKNYSLSLNDYLEKIKVEVESPEKVRANYFESYKKVSTLKEELKEMLIEGGFANE